MKANIAQLLALLLLTHAGSAAADIDDSVEATPALQKMLTLETVQPTEVQDSLRLSARVELDELRTARIGATVTGRITQIDAVLGQNVKKGQRLAVLDSTELGKAQSDYLKANSQVNLRRMTVERALRLVESGVLSTAELQERQAVLKEAEVDLRTARDQLRVMGMQDAELKRLDKEQNIHSFSNISASLDGTVVERHITLGQVVQPADSLYTVTDLSHLWLVAEVPEHQAYWARQGDRVQAEIPALPGSEIDGQLIYVADMVNSETRTVTVRMALENPERLYKPQMLATLTVSKPGSQTLTVSSRAVIRENNRDHIFVQSANNRYRLRSVELGREEGGRRTIVSGLKRGEIIVSDGSFHLNNERLRGALE